MTSTEPPFVPDDFTVPRALAGDGFRLEPLGPGHNERDLAAWSSSVDHIRATPGFGDRAWPPAAGMTAAENLGDLEQHAADFADRTGFTFTVLDAADEVVGCVYIYPSRTAPATADVRSWTRATHAALDGPLHTAVTAWLSTAWPFPTVRYR